MFRGCFSVIAFAGRSRFTKSVHDGSAGGIARDVDGGAQHIKDAVYAKEDGQGFNGDAGGNQYGNDEQGGAGNTRLTNGT
jgi:hypothetical protein